MQAPQRPPHQHDSHDFQFLSVSVPVSTIEQLLTGRLEPTRPCQSPCGSLHPFFVLFSPLFPKPPRTPPPRPPPTLSGFKRPRASKPRRASRPAPGPVV